MTDVKEKIGTIFGLKIVGYLAADNKLFDRTCPNCKGMYSSLKTSICPKCGNTLTFIIGGNGKSMAISEGTIFPAYSTKQKERNAKAIANRKNGMPVTYRFKMFSFADDTGVLSIPPEHGRCRKGAKIQLITINHDIVPSWYLSKPDPATQKRGAKLEIMVMIYTNYGDSITVLSDADFANKTVSYMVNKDGTPAPMQDPAAQAIIEQLQKTVAVLEAKVNAQAAAIAAPAAMTAEVNAFPEPTSAYDPSEDYPGFESMPMEAEDDIPF
jgi:hypothetical protein